MDERFKDRKGWRETAVAIVGEVKKIAPAFLLGELLPRHPRLSGWPIWIDSRQLGEENAPYPVTGGWEALVVLENVPAFVAIPMIDFWRLESVGRFYHRRSYEDDAWATLTPGLRGKLVDFPGAIQRVAEAVATAAVFGRHLAVAPEDASIVVSVRWSNLQGRTLASWSEPGRFFSGIYKAHDDNLAAEVTVPLATSRASLGPYVEELVRPLFDVFGAPLSSPVIQEIAEKALKVGPM